MAKLIVKPEYKVFWFFLGRVSMEYQHSVKRLFFALSLARESLYSMGREIRRINYDILSCSKYNVYMYYFALTLA